MKNRINITVLMAMLGCLALGCEESETDSSNPNPAVNTPATNVQNNSAMIVPGVGVGPIRLGMTVDQMKQILGKPDIAVTGFSYVYADLGIEVIAKDKQTISSITCVHHIDNASPAVTPCQYKTDEGIGIGSTVAEVIAAYGELPNPPVRSMTYKELGMRMLLVDGQVDSIILLKTW